MRVCVHGLGHLGQLTAALFATAGHTVYGYSLERDAATVDELPAVGPGARAPLNDDQYDVSIETCPVEADCHSVCVAVPYDSDRSRAEMVYVEQAARKIAETIRAGDTVVLASTVPPGTTAGRFYRTVSRSGKVPERDFSLGYVPAGDPNLSTVERFLKSDRVVGGVGPDSTDAVTDLYRSVSEGDVRVAPDTTTAEFAWLARLAKRDVEVAYANQLRRLADDYGVDVWESIELASGGERTDIAKPGLAAGSGAPGVGSLFFGQWSDETALLRCTQQLNARMVDRIVKRLTEALDSLHDATIAVLGAGYEQDMFGGNAVSQRVGSELAHSGPITDGGLHAGEIRVHDPVVDESSEKIVSLERAVEGADAIVIAARRSAFTELSPEQLGDLVANRLVIDAVGALDGDQWIDAGFRYVSV